MSQQDWFAANAPQAKSGDWFADNAPSVPPLPPGYQLEQGAVPPLPPGYTLQTPKFTIEDAPVFTIEDGPSAADQKAAGAIPHPHPGTSIHWQNPPGTAQERKQATQQVLAGAAPSVGASVGELAGPIGSGVGAGVGTLAQTLFTGGKPDFGKAAENALLYGGSSKLLSMVPDAFGKLADWFGLGAKSAPEEWQAVNQALGVRGSQVRTPIGATSPDDMWGIPGRSVVERAGVTARELSGMTPFQQAARIAPAWKAAGSEVDAVADTATKAGLRLDVGKSVTKAIQNIDSPQLQDRALKVLSDTAQQLGMQDWRTATPNEALQLRRALWQNLGTTQWGKPLYGAISGDLKAAVPQLAPADQAFSELQGAIEAIKRGQQSYMVTPQPSAAAKAWNSIPAPVRRVLPYAGVATGGGYAMAKLSDLLGR